MLKLMLDSIPAEQWGDLFLVSAIALMALLTIVPTEKVS